MSVKEIENDLTELKESVSSADIVVDCLLGIGAAGAAKGIYKEIINVINDSRAIKISADIPSGMNADTGETLDPAVKADYTYAMGFLKQGCQKNQAQCGQIKVLSIGLKS